MPSGSSSLEDAMRLGRIVLCYPDGDRIIVDKEKDLEKYDLGKASAVDVVVSLSVEEFAAVREKKSLLP